MSYLCNVKQLKLIIMIYRVTISTDPYNGSRLPGFKYNCDHTLSIKLIDEFDDYDDAVKCLINEYNKVFGTCVKSCNELKKDLFHYRYADCNFGCFADGSIYFTYDVFEYYLAIIDDDE